MPGGDSKRAHPPAPRLSASKRPAPPHQEHGPQSDSQATSAEHHADAVRCVGARGTTGWIKLPAPQLEVDHLARMDRNGIREAPDQRRQGQLARAARELQRESIDGGEAPNRRAAAKQVSAGRLGIRSLRLGREESYVPESKFPQFALAIIRSGSFRAWNWQSQGVFSPDCFYHDYPAEYLGRLLRPNTIEVAAIYC